MSVYKQLFIFLKHVVEWQTNEVKKVSAWAHKPADWGQESKYILIMHDIYE